jgi:hypothetical protein
MENKKIESNLIFDCAILISFLILVTILLNNNDSYLPIDENYSCDNTDIMKIQLHTLDSEYIDYKVVDFYVEDIEISKLYDYEVCRELLNVELNNTLSKNKNLSFYIYDVLYYTIYNDMSKEIECYYKIYFGEFDDDSVVDTNYISFDEENFKYEREQRVPKFNESFITIEEVYGGEFTRIKNKDMYHNVVVVLKLSEKIEVCN